MPGSVYHSFEFPVFKASVCSPGCAAEDMSSVVKTPSIIIYTFSDPTYKEP